MPERFPPRKLIPSDAEFPSEILQIPPAPLYLYLRGTIPAPFERRISVVGSRRMTRYGQDMVCSLVGDLADAGLTIVSGLALGVDGAAHAQALEHSAGTIAVLGGGISDATIGPRSHWNLAHQILESGSCILSEFPPDQVPHATFFPLRNRIIAALSPATLIIEAARKSGALITADLALNAGREVWAVPGNVGNPQSAGTNQLLRVGAHAAVHVQDILDSYGITATAATSSASQRILSALSDHPRSLEVLAHAVSLSSSECARELSQLELAGIVTRCGALYKR